jgi:hypothetical protein
MEALKARQMAIHLADLMVRHLARPMEALMARQMARHLARRMEAPTDRPMA